MYDVDSEPDQQGDDARHPGQEVEVVDLLKTAELVEAVATAPAAANVHCRSTVQSNVCMMCLPVDQPDEGPDQGSQLEITEAVERDLLTRHV